MALWNSRHILFLQSGPTVVDKILSLQHYSLPDGFRKYCNYDNFTDKEIYFQVNDLPTLNFYYVMEMVLEPISSDFLFFYSLT